MLNIIICEIYDKHVVVSGLTGIEGSKKWKNQMSEGGG